MLIKPNQKGFWAFSALVYSKTSILSFQTLFGARTFKPNLNTHKINQFILQLLLIKIKITYNQS